MPARCHAGPPSIYPTELKAAYINLLLQVGFDMIDFGSFVSAKAIPQMSDTTEVLQKLDLSSTQSKLLAIVANYRGAEEAAQHPEIAYLGFPFSISETFQRRNANSGINEALEIVKKINGLCDAKAKKCASTFPWALAILTGMNGALTSFIVGPNSSST